MVNKNKGILVSNFQDSFSQDRNTSEKYLEYQEELEQFFHLTPDAIIVADFDGYIHRYNPILQKILGYSTAELSGKKIQELVHPQDLENDLELIQKLAKGQEVTYYENRCISKEGKINYFEWSATPLRNKNLFFAVGKDITKRKKIEQEMARLDRLSLVAEMAAGISHEVRNPITTVRGFLQILHAKERDPRNIEYFQIMIEELDRANSIITEFLSLSRNPVDFTYLNINEIITALAPLIEADALRQDKNMIIKLSEVPKLLVNEKEIRQILLNLTRNGLEAMQPGGVIRVKTLVENNKVILSVQDQGAGIPAAILEKLGTPFITTKDNGTGLGLATCFSIAARHHAKITVETGNAGTTFLIHFDPKCILQSSVVN